MRQSHYFSRLLLLSGLLIAPVCHAAPVPVTATFSILGDLVHQVGGTHVEVTTLVGADGDAHVYQPSPQAVRILAQSKLLVSNGLGFEGWLERLHESSGFKGEVVVASQGITPLNMAKEEQDVVAHDSATGAEGEEPHQHGAFDPHAWNDPVNVLIYIDNITQGLSRVDPEHQADYAANAAAYKMRLQAMDGAFKARFAALPESRRKAITSHDAFGYLAHAYHLTLLAPQGLSTEAEPSAAQVAILIRQIRQQHIPALFVENISDPRLMEQISRETKVTIGGKLYSDALSGPQGEAPDYLALLNHNLSTLLKALEP
jgi:zinc/manganese transport system substrate-binding protein